MSEVMTEPCCDWVQNPFLKMERFSSLEERVATEKPHLRQGLSKLKELLGEALFAKYINRVQNISKNDSTLLLVAGSEMRRTHILRECVPALKEAFGVRTVRVIGGGGFAGADAF